MNKSQYLAEREKKDKEIRDIIEKAEKVAASIREEIKRLDESYADEHLPETGLEIDDETIFAFSKKESIRVWLNSVRVTPEGDLELLFRRHRNSPWSDISLRRIHKVK